MGESYAPRALAFLDTNFVHFVGLYLDYAKGENLFPHDGNLDPEAKEAAVDCINQFPEEDLRASLRRGLEVVSQVVSRKLGIRYATASELELLAGRTRGKAIVSAANEGLPDRMWSRFRAEEIRERVSGTALEDTKVAVENLGQTIETSGLVVQAAREEDERTTIELAKEVNGKVYVDALDSIVYASAVLAQADYLFTADNYLHETVNLIHTPDGDRHYERMRKDLRAIAARLILGEPVMPDDEERIVLPSAHSVSRKGNMRPSFPSPS